MTLAEIAAHPATYGVAAALARWALGDRLGGGRALISYVVCSLFVAWGASLYLSDELAMTSGRKSFYLMLLAFVAKDILTALAAIAVQFRVDPLGVFKRFREAMSGGPKQ